MSSIQSVSAQRLYRLIADQLAEKIRTGEFAPGERLPAERDLADRLKVARSTLREALIALEIRGYVEVRVGSGVFVLAPQPDRSDLASVANAAAVGDTPAAADVSPFQLIETRLLVEPDCAALAAQHGTREQIDAIRALHDSMTPAHTSHVSDLEWHRAFHEAIAAASGNAVLASVISHVWDLTMSNPLYRRLDAHFVTEPVWEFAVDEHAHILNAIVEGNPIRARHAMSTHLLGIAARLSVDIGTSGSANPDIASSQSPREIVSKSR
ncbi:FadR/GntR family transcriptional regulator [Burkholderia cepacia]|uniref:FadR/GntR family transcriptional regulator n=1 Tax=Burkholderia cepacia TaxID=292 RepID=UPI00075856BF|nr:FadR/GntR family transcriptional regulator [Burkholderia cepacia]KWC91784.1 GntR family transcriptional regulator [Burkholderia cepacia]